MRASGNIGVYFFSILFLVTISCSSKKTTDELTDSDESTANISESAMSEAGQQSTSSEGASSPSLMKASAIDGNPNIDAIELGFNVAELDYLDPQSASLRPSAACTFASARSTCTSNVSTINWNNCSVGLAQLSGGWTETWSGGFCANGAQASALTNGNSVTRTTSSQILTLASGAKLTTSTTAHTNYLGTTIPGTGVTVSMAGGARTVVINGLHKVMTGPRGRTWFDHSITSTGLSVTGTRAGGNRVVTGTTTMYHNLAKYTATHTFNSVTWGSSSCCYPTSGSISSSLSGTGRSGNVTLAFSSTCGEATFTDTDASTSSVTLTHCN